MSLKSAIVMYRVDGVSGLNVFTGIITKVLSATLEVSRPSFLSLGGNQLSVRKHAVLSPVEAKRSADIIKSNFMCNTFFKLFSAGSGKNILMSLLGEILESIPHYVAT